MKRLIDSTKESQLLKDLEQVREEIKSAEQQLGQLPDVIGKAKEELASKVSQALHRHKAIKQIPGSDEEDRRQIEEIDQIRLRAVKAVQDALGLM